MTTEAHLLIADAKGLAGLGMDKSYDDLLYKLCDALDEAIDDRDEGWRQLALTLPPTSYRLLVLPTMEGEGK